MFRKQFAVLLSLSIFFSGAPAAFSAGADAQKPSPFSVPSAKTNSPAPSAATPKSESAAFTVPALTSTAPATRPQSAPASGYLLKGTVTTSGTPPLLLEGVTQELPQGTKVDLTLMCNLNSEVSQVGDEVHARVGVTVKDGRKVLLPEGWYLRGTITDSSGPKRLGRNGFVDVEFDKLVSPNGDIELPFHAKVSTKDNQLKAIAKIAAIDAGYVTVGAAAGAIMSVQFTGIPLAVATHGYSVAIGAGVGATIGAIGALKRKGKISSLYPGDEMKLTVAEPITLPGFNPDALASSHPPAKLQNFELLIKKAQFLKDPMDSQARLLRVDIAIDNQTKKEYRLSDFAVVSDRNQRYGPYAYSGFSLLGKRIAPNSKEESVITFSVDSPKRKYFLVLLDRNHVDELTRIPIN
jgi:hypothetical protein